MIDSSFRVAKFVSGAQVLALVFLANGWSHFGVTELRVVP
jgi:hypothetical protein